MDKEPKERITAYLTKEERTALRVLTAKRGQTITGFLRLMVRQEMLKEEAK